MKILLSGSQGRLGSLIALKLDERGLDWQPLGELQTPKSGTSQLLKPLEQAAKQGEELIVIDVTLPSGTEALCSSLSILPESLTETIRSIVVGTTGHSPEQLEQMAELASRTPVALVSNFSRGILLLQEALLATTRSGLSVAEYARALGFDLGIFEAHHTAKKDSPSGTALTLAQSAKIDMNKISSLRVGQIIGEHTVLASGHSEDLRFAHIAQSREIFASGAIQLVELIHQSKPAKKLWTFADLMNDFLSKSRTTN